MGAGADHRPAPRAGAAREHGRQQPKHRISSAPGPAMQVQLVAAPVAPPVPDSMPDLAPAAPELTEPPPLPELPPSAAPERDEVVYYVQDELDHKVVVLKDETGEAELDAPPGVVMHLFIDAYGAA
ncbi:hypothetical protein LP420_16850 [Massilia sp. B-10]|nr:hypothetical protein LP420_16850 [Massilia sp. B-10]